MIPDFWRSRLSSNFGTSKCMLAASIWVAWHLHSLYGVGEASEVRGTEAPPGTRVTFFRTSKLIPSLTQRVNI